MGQLREVRVRAASQTASKSLDSFVPEGRESACSAGDPASIRGSGRSPEEGNNYRLQYPCLENPIFRRAWRATVHGVSKSQTQLSDRHSP